MGTKKEWKKVKFEKIRLERLLERQEMKLIKIERLSKRKRKIRKNEDRKQTRKNKKKHENTLTSKEKDKKAKKMCCIFLPQTVACQYMSSVSPYSILK